MTTNNENLDFLTRKIFILEIVEKIKNCGMMWNHVSSNSYQISYQTNNELWHITISKNYSSGIVTLDFSKNNTFFLSINSEIDENVIQIFNEIDVDEDYNKDKEILKEISLIPICPEFE